MKKNSFFKISLIMAFITVFSSIHSQNVGIGTTSPLSKLHIRGQLRVDTLLSGVNTDSVLTVDNNGVFRRRNASFFNTNIYNADGALTGNRSVFMGTNSLAFDTTTFFLNPSTNRVGIGTNAPLEVLDVRGNAQFGTNDTTNFIAFRGLTADGNGGYGFTYIGNRLYSGSDKSELVIYQGNDADNAGGPDRIRLMSGEHRFQTTNVNILNTTFPTIARDTNFIDRMIIKSDGKIGVGTTSPSDLLDINGTARVRTLGATSNSDNIVYADANGVLKRGAQTANQTSKLLNYIAIDDVTLTNSTFNSTTLTDMFLYNYTPVSSNSKIIVEYHNQNYTLSGVYSSTAVDDWEAWLGIGAQFPTINYWAASSLAGEMNRSSTLLPIKGVYTNAGTAAITIKLQIKKINSDDTLTFRQANGGWNGSLTIQEIGN